MYEGAYHPLPYSYVLENAMTAVALPAALSSMSVAGRLAPSRRAPAELRITDEVSVPVHERELWTSRQRQASSIHQVSYRACFKP